MHKFQLPYSLQDVFSLSDPEGFNRLALKAFHFQYQHNLVYHRFCDFMKVDPLTIQSVDKIPFLPIELFKNHKVVCGNEKSQIVFRSSGTTGSIRSEHYMMDIDWYNKTLLQGFKLFFGDPSRYAFAALLPGYIERPDSSLIHMVNQLMQRGKNSSNSFFKEPGEEFTQMIRFNQQAGITTILFGVSFSLLEFANQNPIDLKDVILIETGGMKGHGQELTKGELHSILKQKFHLPQVCSEYGMTELMSQAYCLNNEMFETPPWMQILIREANDPKTFLDEGRGGGMNIIDLANIYSCCFIATADLGKKTSPNTFEVLGRFDNADIRGCNLLFA